MVAAAPAAARDSDGIRLPAAEVAARPEGATVEPGAPVPAAPVAVDPVAATCPDFVNPTAPAAPLAADPVPTTAVCAVVVPAVVVPDRPDSARARDAMGVPAADEDPEPEAATEVVTAGVPALAVAETPVNPTVTLACERVRRIMAAFAMAPSPQVGNYEDTTGPACTAET